MGERGGQGGEDLEDGAGAVRLYRQWWERGAGRGVRTLKMALAQCVCTGSGGREGWAGG